MALTLAVVGASVMAAPSVTNQAGMLGPAALYNFDDSSLDTLPELQAW